MKTYSKMRRGFTLVELLVVISIIATLAGVGVPVIISKQKDGARAEAIANIKQIGLAMFTFDQDYGSYPSDATGIEVKNNNPESGLTFGSASSNDFFRQLIAAGIIDTEKSFYAKAPYTKKPDNVMSQSKCLAAGECGFAYIMASNTEPLSSSGNSGRPLVAAAVYNGLTNGTFDPDVYAKKAVIFRIDNSAIAEAVRPSDKKVIVGGGKTLLQGGDKDTVWGTDINPVIKAPEKNRAGSTSQLNPNITPP
jgi:prepilin-type N-terminal cleavage/methylation domain-containing protein